MEHFQENSFSALEKDSLSKAQMWALTGLPNNVINCKNSFYTNENFTFEYLVPGVFVSQLIERKV